AGWAPVGDRGQDGSATSRFVPPVENRGHHSTLRGGAARPPHAGTRSSGQSLPTTEEAMTRSRQFRASSAGKRSRWLPLLVAFVLMACRAPWSSVPTAAEDSPPAARAAQVVGQLPQISLPGKTGGTLNMGISFDAATMDPAQTQNNLELWVEMEVF